MSETWTIKKLLDWVSEYFTDKGIDSPRLSAELLLSHVLDTQRIMLYANFDKTVAPSHLDTLRPLVKRCGAHEPLAYLIGHTEFYSLRFVLTPDVLIPRPETEGLVEKAIDFLRALDTPEPKVLDLCTGSGCIAGAIAKNVPSAKLTATDISKNAIRIAQKNFQSLGIGDRIETRTGDLFDAIEPGETFDLIVSNPPYVTDGEYENLDPNVKDYEPAQALKAGPEGLDLIEKIIQAAPASLAPKAALILEMGYRHGSNVQNLLQNANYTDIRIHKDHAGHDRIAFARK